MKKLPALAGALVVLLCTPVQSEAQTYRHDSADRKVIVQIVYHRNMAWRWQDRAHHKRSETRYRERTAPTQVLPRLQHYWEHRHYLAWRAWTRVHAAEVARSVPAGLPPHYSAWLCIHRYEGSWTDSGSPYWGGLQMDIGFQSTYGGALLSTKGTADHWTPLEQMWVAERAYASGRGFYPWPNTARYCGLI